MSKHFDGDLAKGKLREDAFARILLGGRELWEHKRDYKCADTGNIALEYETSELPNGQGKHWPSGIAVCTAHWFVIEYMPDRRLVMTLDEVKCLARRAILTPGTSKPRHLWCGDDNRFHNALVPFDWFKEPVALRAVRDVAA